MSSSAAPIPLRPASAAIASIDKIPFSDLYVRLGVDGTDDSSFFRYGPNPQGKTGNAPVPAQYRTHLALIAQQIENAGPLAGVITVDDMRLRYQKAKMADGSWRAAVRRIQIVPPLLQDLNMHPEAMVGLRQWARATGLLLIGGATGAGKTTTGVSILCEYLELHGGVAITIEDPPEYLLQGTVGSKGGHCDQIAVESDEDWEHATNTALRWRPRYVFYGEIRSPEAAAQALRASGSGHLIIATAHGGSIADTIGTVTRNAEVRIGPAAKLLVANNLAGVVHQRFGQNGPFVDILNVPRGGQTSEETQLRKMLADDGDLGQRQQSLKGFIKRYAAEA